MLRKNNFVRIQFAIVTICSVIIGFYLYRFIEESVLQSPTVHVITRREVVSYATRSIQVNFHIEQIPALNVEDIRSVDYRVRSASLMSLKGITTTSVVLQRTVAFRDGRVITSDPPDLIMGQADADAIEYRAIGFVKGESQAIYLYTELVRLEEFRACSSREWRFTVEGRADSDFCARHQDKIEDRTSRA